MSSVLYDAEWYAIVEAEHVIQNPVSARTIRALGQWLGLGPKSRVLDVACGTCGPAIVLAQEYGCQLTCIDKTPAFLKIARRRIGNAGLTDRIELVRADAALLKAYAPPPWDAALCLGASFVFGGLVPALERLAEASPLIAIGEPFVDLDATVQLAETAGVTVTTVFVSTDKEWRDYETTRMVTLEQWLRTRPEHAFTYRRREREAQRRRREEHRGWAILVCCVDDSHGIAA